MKSDPKWMPVTIVFVVLSLTVAELEPSAFGQNRDDARTVIARAPTGNVRDAIAKAVAQSQTPAAAARIDRPPDLSVPAPRKRKAWKWIVGAVGAGVAVAVLTRGGEPSTPGGASIVVGPPSVGQPQ